ncbi:HAD family hydrolase [Candidatus Woesearchaeota archaeon]|nr:HAD family hydrolase [Candidatus Woesearchaeota archaeon]
MKPAKDKVKAIIFDIDGVLVDTSRSYSLAIKKTAEFFLGKILKMEDVEAVKNRGINDDWDASEILIRENGGDFRKKAIIKKFQEYYLGRNMDGFVKDEKCIIKSDVLKKLKNYKLGIFTGRPKKEADYCLDRFGIIGSFSTVVAKEDVTKGKPDPEGLLKAIQMMKVKKAEAVYVGDNISDLRSAKEAGISFIGVIPPNVDKACLRSLLASEGAEIVLDDINDIVKNL